MEHRSNVSSCLGHLGSQKLGCRAKPSCKYRVSQNFSFTFQLHGETTHSKDHVEAGDPALKAMHREKMTGKQRKLFSKKKTLAYTLLGTL